MKNLIKVALSTSLSSTRLCIDWLNFFFFSFFLVCLLGKAIPSPSFALLKLARDASMPGKLEYFLRFYLCKYVGI